MDSGLPRYDEMEDMIVANPDAEEDISPTPTATAGGYDISEEKLEEIKQNVMAKIDRADNFYEQEIEEDVIKRHKIYESDKTYYDRKFPKLSKITDVAASDMHDTIEWAIPSLIKVFFGGEDICKLEGVNSEADDKAAKVHGELIKYQLERHNDGFLIFYDWIKNSLIDNIGFLK